MLPADFPSVAAAAAQADDTQSRNRPAGAPALISGLCIIGMLPSVAAAAAAAQVASVPATQTDDTQSRNRPVGAPAPMMYHTRLLGGSHFCVMLFLRRKKLCDVIIGGDPAVWYDTSQSIGAGPVPGRFLECVSSVCYQLIFPSVAAAAAPCLLLTDGL